MTVSLKTSIENKLGRAIENNEFEKLTKLMFEKSFDKKIFLAEEGVVCNHIYFIEQGSCYSYFIEPEGEKQVVQLAIEGNWISDLFSFFSVQPHFCFFSCKNSWHSFFGIMNPFHSTISFSSYHCKGVKYFICGFICPLLIYASQKK